MKNRWLFLIGALIFSLLAIPGFTAESAEKQSSIDPVLIEIKTMQFTPVELVVAAGTTVTWTNLDPVDHDVTSGVSVTGRKSRDLKKTKFPDNIFSSGLFGKDKTFSVTFDEKGEYDYYCNIHPFMVARIVVE